MKAKVCSNCRTIMVGECKCKTPTPINTAGRGYNRKWRKFRERLFRKRLLLGPITCAMCGRVFGKEAFHADHIMPVNGADDPLFFDESNIQFLHPDCHGQKTKTDVLRGLTR